MFKLLLELNKVVLPGYDQNDQMQLATLQKAILGFR